MVTARSLDKFYTKKEIAQDCIEFLSSLFTENLDDFFWVEPSAGEGAFLDFIPKSAVAIDIAPASSAILPIDFFDWCAPVPEKKIVTVGNPPFGKNAALARRFFDHAAGFSEIIAFILPRTFQKQNFVNRLDRNMHLLAEKELDDYSFEFEGQPYAVPTVFQVWQKSPELRPIIAANRTHPDFSFVQARDADFAFQRVGARAGMVSFDGLRKSPQSHYFIRANIDARRLFNRLDSIDWNPVKWRTAGNPSIGKGELVSSYESCFA